MLEILNCCDHVKKRKPVMMLSTVLKYTCNPPDLFRYSVNHSDE